MIMRKRYAAETVDEQFTVSAALVFDKRLFYRGGFLDGVGSLSFLTVM
jgi:hypothetical protein